MAPLSAEDIRAMRTEIEQENKRLRNLNSKSRSKIEKLTEEYQKEVNLEKFAINHNENKIYHNQQKYEDLGKELLKINTKTP